MRLPVLFLATALLPVAPVPAAAASANDDVVAALHQLFDDDWQRQLREDPVQASYLGDARYNDRWPTLTLAAIEASHAADRAELDRLLGFARETLPPAEQLNYDLFGRELRLRLEGYHYRQYLIPLNQRGGVQTADELLEVLRFDTAVDYRNWLSRLRALDTYIDQHIAIMREGLLAGVVPPKIIMQRIPEQLAHQLVAQAEDSPYYAPFRALPAGLPAAERAALQTEARTIISGEVLPAYQRFAKFFSDEYLPGCRDSIGASSLPDGEHFYAYRARLYTSTDLSPAEIHAIGLTEVARIRGEMDAIIGALGFKGSYPEFLAFLRSDPQFYYSDPQRLFEAYLATAKRIDPLLVNLFGKLPRTPYGLRAIPEASAPDTTTAYYQPPAADGSRAGYYYVNLYRPETRPKYEMMALTLHESVPGHHLQIALAQELGELPNFRKHGGYTAFVEGWGLYAEHLGYELGLYDDPYSRFGALTYEMWRAVRLVVDTGMHAQGWSRQQAIDYFKANAAKSQLDIINEIDRYIAWPGQALAYKIGELKIKALRQRAETALGERFDVRAFHDRVLGSGAVPLDVLEADIGRWIAEQQAQP